MIGLLIGVALGTVIFIFARLTKFDRDRSFYPTILIVIASYYVLFGLQAADQLVTLREVLVFSLFFAGAVAGHRGSNWIIAAFLLAHGIYDVFLPHAEAPAWWPAFCLGVDIVLSLGVVLAGLRQNVKAA